MFLVGFFQKLGSIKKVAWYLRRLRAMSLLEIFYRVRQRTRVELDRRVSKQDSFEKLTMPEARTRFRAEESSSFFLAAEIKTRYGSNTVRILLKPMHQRSKSLKRYNNIVSISLTNCIS